MVGLGMFALGLIAACSGPGGHREVHSSPSLSTAVLETGPPGYVAVSNGVSGSLDIVQAASTAPAKSDQTAAWLDRSSYDGGFARVWTRDQDFINLALFHFARADDAARFATFETDYLRHSNTVFVVPEVDIHGGQTYVLSGQTRAGSHRVFCQGVIFAVLASAYIVDTCGSQGNSADTAISLAREQYVRALKSDRPSPAASPSP